MTECQLRTRDVRLCHDEATAVVEGICVHEHVQRAQVCDRHADLYQLQSGYRYCVPCYECIPHHVCRVRVLAVTPL